jgi:two-component system repressor protein LuxO
MINTLENEKLKIRGYYRFIGTSKPMQTIYQIIDNVATSKVSVFITGESGTGKELCAEAIHKKSKRKDKPFVVLNCTAIPKDLMESELFGHVKGAFTGADKNRLGAASLADGGTLFLDEIGDLDLNLQAKLLRFVQTSTFQKVGSSQLKKVDIRFICATHHDPITAIKAGRFREDLYYRLNVISIKLPALRQREDDVLLLAKHFLMRYTKYENKSFVNFAPETEEILKNYDWPGNVRQLQNVIHNIVVLNDAETVMPEMLLSILENYQTELLPSLETPSQSSVKILPLWQAEKKLIEQAIELCGGNIAKAAFMLEIDASTIYRKRRKWKKIKN